MTLSDLRDVILGRTPLPPEPTTRLTYTVERGARRTYTDNATLIDGYPNFHFSIIRNINPSFRIFLRDSGSHRLVLRIYKTPRFLLIGANTAPQSLLLSNLLHLHNLIHFLVPHFGQLTLNRFGNLHLSTDRGHAALTAASYATPIVNNDLVPDSSFFTHAGSNDVRGWGTPSEDTITPITGSPPPTATPTTIPHPPLNNVSHILILNHAQEPRAIPISDPELTIKVVSRALSPTRPFLHTHNLHLTPTRAPTLEARLTPAPPQIQATTVAV